MIVKHSLPLFWARVTQTAQAVRNSSIPRHLHSGSMISQSHFCKRRLRVRILLHTALQCMMRRAILWWPRRTLLRFSHCHFPNRIFAFHIGFSRFISDFRISYRILASHIGFSRLKSDSHITFPNRIFAPQIGFLRFKIEIRLHVIRKELYSWKIRLLGHFSACSFCTKEWSSNPVASLQDYVSKFYCKLYCLALVIRN